jgi:hypothetical protein
MTNFKMLTNSKNSNGMGACRKSLAGLQDEEKNRSEM